MVARFAECGMAGIRVRWPADRVVHLEWSHTLITKGISNWHVGNSDGTHGKSKMRGSLIGRTAPNRLPTSGGDYKFRQGVNGLSERLLFDGNICVVLVRNADDRLEIAFRISIPCDTCL
jgi:hypothetical protein